MSVADEITRYNGLKNRVATATTAISTAITAKGGTVAQGDGLEDYASDIASIPSGGSEDFDALIARTATKIKSETATSVGYYGFNSYQTNLQYVNLPQVTGMGAGAFGGCWVLTKVFLPKCVWITWQCFSGCAQLTSLCLPSVTDITTEAFVWSQNFEELVLGYSNLVNLGDINAFRGTKFDANKSGGTLYVPANLISTYESATNWSAIFARNANNQIKSIATTDFSGDGTTTTFTLTDNNAHPDTIFYIKIGNDYVNPDDFAYNSTTGVITFATAPASGTDNINVYFKGVEVI